MKLYEDEEQWINENCVIWRWKQNNMWYISDEHIHIHYTLQISYNSDWLNCSDKNKSLMPICPYLTINSTFIYLKPAAFCSFIWKHLKLLTMKVRVHHSGQLPISVETQMGCCCDCYVVRWCHLAVVNSCWLMVSWVAAPCWWVQSVEEVEAGAD